MNTAIEISGLSKSYGEIKAVSDISFSVVKGEVFRMLGFNGAGKTIFPTTHYVERLSGCATGWP